MHLTLQRHYFGNAYTIGKLYLDGVYFCDTLEDAVRQLPAACPDTARGQACRCSEKVYARTAIPAGVYKVTLEYSPRFKRILPLLHDVPHFLGILIHSGNDADDSAGCILVGRNRAKGKVVESRATSDKLNALLTGYRSITIRIE